MTVWFGLSNLGTFGTISQLSELQLNYRSLRWNRGAEPVLLSIKTLNLKTIFFSELRLNYRLLRWNRGAEPVLLSIITLNLKTIFFLTTRRAMSDLNEQICNCSAQNQWHSNKT